MEQGRKPRFHRDTFIASLVILGIASYVVISVVEGPRVRDLKSGVRVEVVTWKDRTLLYVHIPSVKQCGPWCNFVVTPRGSGLQVDLVNAVYLIPRVFDFKGPDNIIDVTDDVAVLGKPLTEIRMLENGEYKKVPFTRIQLVNGNDEKGQ